MWITSHIIFPLSSALPRRSSIASRRSSLGFYCALYLSSASDLLWSERVRSAREACICIFRQFCLCRFLPGNNHHVRRPLSRPRRRDAVHFSFSALLFSFIILSLRLHLSAQMKIPFNSLAFFMFTAAIDEIDTTVIIHYLLLVLWCAAFCSLAINIFGALSVRANSKRTVIISLFTYFFHRFSPFSHFLINSVS